MRYVIVGYGVVGRHHAAFVNPQKHQLKIHDPAKGYEAEFEPETVYVIAIGPGRKWEEYEPIYQRLEPVKDKVALLFVSTLSIPILKKIYEKGIPYAVFPERVQPPNSDSESRLFGFSLVTNDFVKDPHEFWLEAVKPWSKHYTLILTHPVGAVLTKLLENSIRALQIALVEKLAMMTGSPQIVKLLNTHHNVNLPEPRYGIGGLCLRKDVQLLIESSEEMKEIFGWVVPCDDEYRQWVYERLKIRLDIDDKILWYGVAYKDNVGITEESPALQFVSQLRAEGYKVDVVDPYVGIDESESEEYDVLVLAVHGDKIPDRWKVKRVLKLSEVIW